MGREVEEVERHERQVRRRARCWEWLKTRSDKRIRSNLEGFEEEGGNKDEGEEPHVKPFSSFEEGLLQSKQTKVNRRRKRTAARVSAISEEGETERRLMSIFFSRFFTSAASGKSDMTTCVQISRC